MFDTFSRYIVFRNTTFHNYDVHMILRYSNIDFWTSVAYPCCVGCRICLCAVRAVRCADLVLTLQTKDDPTDKFDDAFEFVRQFVTFFEVASLRAAPWAQGGSSRSLLRLFAAQREPAKQRASPAQNLNENRLQRQQNREILCKRSTRDDTSMISCPPPDPPVD